MTYIIIIPKSVIKQFDLLPVKVADEILDKIGYLKHNPRPINARKMKASKGFRLRVGNYRVIYDIDDDGKRIVLRRVGHRSNIYKHNGT